MDARAQRTLIRVGTLLGALVVAFIVIAFVPNLDPRLDSAIIGLGITAALGLDKWINNSSEEIAAPTVAGMHEEIASAIVNTSPAVSATPAPSSAPAPAPAPSLTLHNSD